MVGAEIYVSNLQSFQSALDRARRASSDLTIPLTLISRDFYKSERAIFKLQSPGQYTDLSERYKKQKRKAVGFIYPILKRNGALEKSVTEPTAPDSINQIINKNTLIIGTSVPYAYKHQYGVGVPMRPFLFIGPESTYASSEQAGRLTRWNNILNEYVLQVTNREVGS